MEKVSSLSYFGTQIRERRQIWVNRKAESPDTTCDQYAYSCHEAMQLAAATNFRGFSPNPPKSRGISAGAWVKDAARWRCGYDADAGAF